MKHRIHRQIIEVALPEAARNDDLPRRAAQVFQERVLPLLDALFSRLAPEGHILRIERLDIDLGALSSEHWERDFVDACLEHLQRSLSQLSAVAAPAPISGAQVLDPQTGAWEVLLHFLRTGALPWHAAGRRLYEIEAVLADGPPEEYHHTLLALLRQRPAALRRWVWQFSPVWVQRVTERTLHLPEGWMAQVLEEAQRSGRPAIASAVATSLPAARREALLLLCRHLLFAPPAEWAAMPPKQAAREWMLSIPAQAQPAADGRSTPKRPASRPESEASADVPPPSPKSAPPTLPVEHAGIVLLAPYLTAFFGEVQLIERQIWRSEEHQYRAVHLLHFLATGAECPEEPALLLPKILCGMPTDAPLPADMPLSDAEKAESICLLEAVVRNWPALKNTSPDGLRQAFLQRRGSLNAHLDADQTRLLRIERQGQDILLDRLPWSFSVIRLPWMTEVVRVEW